MKDNNQYSSKTNAFRAMKPPVPSKIRGNYGNIETPKKPKNTETGDNIFTNSMSKMLVDDFWTSFNENAEKFTRNPIVTKDPFLPGQAPRYNTSMMDKIVQNNTVDIQRSKENIYTSTSKTILSQEKIKETPPPPSPQTQTGNRSGKSKGGGSQSMSSVTINNMATIDQTIMAAVMLPIWRQGFVG